MSIIPPIDAAEHMLRSEPVLVPDRVRVMHRIRLIELFDKMIQRHDVQNGQWTFDWSEPDDPDVGFIIRSGERNRSDGSAYDRKIFFHYRPGLEVLLRRRGVYIDRQAEDFLSLAAVHYQAFYDTAVDIAAGHPDESLLPSLLSSGEHVLRLLAYTHERDDDNEIIAAPHIDRALFTFAIDESHGELEFAETAHGDYIARTREAGQAIVFPGAKWQQRYGNEAHWHRVRRLESIRYSEAIIRWSIVFFAHSSDALALSTKAPPKDAA